MIKQFFFVCVGIYINRKAPARQGKYKQKNLSISVG
jgi:hypothetical protein